MAAFKRDIQIGDIHGCFTLLLKLLASINFDPKNDHLTFAGDYIDRGPDSSSVIMYLAELQDEHPEAVTLLKGNHEALAYEALTDGDNSEAALLWTFNGATPTLKSFSSHSAAADYILPFLDRLVLSYETKDHITVHAGLQPDIPLENQPIKTLLWNRNFSRPHYSGKTVIAGHTIHSDITRYPGYICIDTGAYSNKKLSAYDLISGTVYQVTK